MDRDYVMEQCRTVQTIVASEMATVLEIPSALCRSHSVPVSLDAAADESLQRQHLLQDYMLKLSEQLNRRTDLIIDFTCLQQCLDPQPDQSQLFLQDKDKKVGQLMELL